MADLITGLRPDRVRANLERVRGEIAAAGRDPGDVEILAAVKYLAVEDLASNTVGNFGIGPGADRLLPAPNS